MKSERKRRAYYDPCQEKVVKTIPCYEKKGKAYCEHYPEGLPVCSKCREESTLAHDKACAELVEARADAEHWKSECNTLQRMVHEARAEIERLRGVIISQITPEPFVLSSYSATTEPAKDERDKLIEQMREALTKLIGTLEVMSVMPETLGKYPVLAIDAPELEQARTALAAERGE